MTQTTLDPSDLNCLIEEISNQSLDQKSKGESNKIKNLNYLELTIFEIWSKMLGFSSFGLNEDLFDVGGDSVTAIQIFSEINKEFGIRLPMEELFGSEMFSIAWLSQLVERYLIELLGKDEFDALLKESDDLVEALE